MRLYALISCSLVACGGSAPMPDAADTGFRKPATSLKANSQSGGVWSELGQANLACLNTATSDQPTTVSVTINEVVKDFQSKNPVPGSNVTVFDGINSGSPFDTQTADGNGDLAVTIPPGHTRFGYKMTTTDGSTLPTFLINQYTDPSTAVEPTGTCTPAPCRTIIQSVSAATAATLPALIGETRMPMSGVLAGALRDCDKHEMSNFIATVSTTHGTATPLSGAETYYFAAGVDLPVHHTQQDSASADALFMVIQLPPSDTAYVQMWGYPTDADVTADQLKLIAELQVPVLADTVITGDYEPLRQ